MRLILLVLLFISFFSKANDGWYADGQLIPDSLWQKHDGKFKAQLFLSDDPETIYKQWNKGPANKVRFTELPRVKSGKHFEAIVVFAGCEKDKQDKCLLTGDWMVKTRDDSILGEAKGSPIYQGTGPKIDKQLMISTNGLGLTANSEDGEYIIKVIVKDKNGNKSVTLEKSIVVE
jgi:hypothetical protein